MQTSAPTKYILNIPADPDYGTVSPLDESPEIEAINNNRICQFDCPLTHTKVLKLMKNAITNT